LVPEDLATASTLNAAAVPAVSLETPAGLRAIRQQAVLALAAVVAPPDGPADPPTLAGFCLVLGPGATYDGEEYAWFSHRYHDFAYVDRVVVDRAQRQRGIGRALYEHVHRMVPALRPGARQVLLEVNIDPPNPPSMAFHRRLGYVDIADLATERAVVRLMGRRLDERRTAP
jgi:predicted GNAT superfamily acetyltransferase